MQSKKQALYLWIVENKKNNGYTSLNVHSFPLYTDRHWNQEADGWPNVPVHRLSQTHNAMSKRGTPSMQSGFVRCSHIYTFIYIQTKKWTTTNCPPARPIHNNIEKWEHQSKTKTTICLQEFFCCFLIVFIKITKGEELFSFHTETNCLWQFQTLCKFVTMQGGSHRAQLSSSTTRDRSWMLLV